MGRDSVSLPWLRPFPISLEGLKAKVEVKPQFTDQAITLSTKSRSSSRERSKTVAYLRSDTIPALSVGEGGCQGAQDPIKRLCLARGAK